TKAPAATNVLAIAAPSAAQAPLVSPTFGNIGFSGVNKPKAVVRRTTVSASRSTVSASRSATRVALPTRVPAPRSAGVLGIAASLAGIYYVYGGTSTSGFDCSGFTQYVFRRIGINLPRTAEQQRQFATPVSNPVPGDLVFFGVPSYHVGIYAGAGRMWDSPRTGTTTGLHTIYSGATYGRV
ncbi:MAG: C40 family peptidase, partial [Actinobacteria bacterium]|nr:C40 family peptidase [Actinomycetota bacterium]